MILTRLARRLKEENWVAVAVEFIILVAGVWLGLQAQEWSNARADRAREQQLLEDFLGDLKLHRADYATAKRLDSKRIEATNTLLTAAGLDPLRVSYGSQQGDLVRYSLNPSEMRSSASANGETLWTDLTMGYFVIPTSIGYDAMTGAGDVRLIRDRNLLRQIQLYVNASDGVGGQTEKLLVVRQDGLRIAAKYGLAPYQSIDKDRLIRLVAANPELAANIRNQGTFTVFHLGDIENANAHAAKLEARLSDYLAKTR